MDLTTLAMVNANDEGDISPLECMVKAVDTLRNELHVHSADDNYLPGMVREVVLPDARAGQREQRLADLHIRSRGDPSRRYHC